MASKCSFCGKAPPSLMTCEGCTSHSYCDSLCQKEHWTIHKAECKRPNYLLKVDLHPDEITNPRITRILSCPASATFASLHESLLLSFGWANTHLNEFAVFDHTNTNSNGNSLDLNGNPPLFKITDLDNPEDDEDADDDWTPVPRLDSSETTLFQIMDNPQTKTRQIIFMYDFDDQWKHVISCIGRADATDQFICVDGEGHDCAEDVGGVAGWAELLKAYDAETPTQSQRMRMDWFETLATNNDLKGLRGEKKWRWNKAKVNGILREMGNTLGTVITAAHPLPSVLLLSHQKDEHFDHVYSAELAKVRSRANVIEATPVALAHLSKPDNYAAVIVADGGVLTKDCMAVQDELVDYAKAGGTVILGFLAAHAKFKDLDRLFKNKFALDWKCSKYTSDTLKLNFCARENPIWNNRNHTNLSRQYHMKALYLGGVRPNDRIYIGTPATQSSAPSPVIFARYGKGFLGYIGCTNPGDETTELLLTMCGI